MTKLVRRRASDTRTEIRGTGSRRLVYILLMQGAPHILIVDDHREIRDLVSRALTKEGFRVSAAADGRAMRKVLADSRIDLIALDLMLPGEDGLSLCRSLRARSSIPIIMLTAKGDELDRVIGLEMGADDYLPKPFGSRELIARIFLTAVVTLVVLAVLNGVWGVKMHPQGPRLAGRHRRGIAARGRHLDCRRLAPGPCLPRLARAIATRGSRSRAASSVPWRSADLEPTVRPFLLSGGPGMVTLRPAWSTCRSGRWHLVLRPGSSGCLVGAGAVAALA